MAGSDYFQSAGEANGIDPDLLRAISKVESDGNNNAVSPVGARGQMQLMPATARGLNVSDPTDPSQSIPAAAKLLVANAKQFGGPEGAILAYHGGTDQKNWGPKTQAYLAKVTQTYQQLKNGSQMAAPAQSQPSDDAFSSAFGSAASAGSSAPPPAAHAGWRQNGTNVEWYDPTGKTTGPTGQAAAPSTPAANGPDPFSVAFGSVSKTNATPAPINQKNPNSGASSTAAITAKPFGLGDDVMAKIPFAKDVVAGGTAALDAGANMLQGKPANFGNTYQANMNALAAKQHEYEATSPSLSKVGTGLSFLMAGGPAAAEAGTAIKAGIPAMMKAGAKSGAMLGGLFGAGTPTQGAQTVDSRAGNALVGAGTGAAIGGALPVVAAPVAAAGRYVGGALNKLIPSGEDVAANKANNIINNFAGGPVKVTNPTQLVAGSQPTLPEATGNPGVAALYRTVRDLNPNSPLIARESENQAARNAAFESAAGTPEDIEHLVDARNAEAKQAREQIFAPTKGIMGAEDHPGYVAATDQVNIDPVVGKIKDVLAGSSGNRPAVKTAMADAMSMLHRDNGEPITDPKTLYDSARKGINDLISGKDLTKSYGATAASQLISVRDALDEAIEKQAPGFKDYLSKYEESSGPIDALKFLQGQNVTDAKGNLTLAKVQGAIKRLDQQQAAPGVKQGKNVTDAQRGVLESIRDDLLRAQNTSLGKAIGSNTVQNSMAQKRLGLAQHINPTLGSVAGGALGYGFGGPQMAVEGAALGGQIGNTLQKAFSYSRATPEMVQNHLEQQLLNPHQYQNPITPSVQPSLNDILNNSKSRAALGIANRLAIMLRARSNQPAN